MANQRLPKRLLLRVLTVLAAISCAFACVDPEDIRLRGTVDVIVVDGTINNLAEPQLIRLHQAQTDLVTGLAEFKAIKKASVDVVIDSALVIACHETTDGNYQLPADFRGQIGHSYQLRFTLSDGTSYESTPQIMPPVPAIQQVALRFNSTSLPKGLLEDFQSGFDVLVDVQDPVNQPNYYRWDWKLWEKQDWCQRCQQGYYMTNQLKLVSSYPNILVYQTQPDLLESCFAAPSPDLFAGGFTRIPTFFSNSYPCRTQCWTIIPSTTMHIFSDMYSNGGLMTSRTVGQIPYYTQNPALVEVRQSSLTADAYRYFNLLQQQSQNTGGLADTPPTALVGNVGSVGKETKKLVGYFTAGAVSSVRYWLDKKDATGIAYGGVYYDPVDRLTKPVAGDKQLVYALDRQLPTVESYLNFSILGGVPRPPTALCVPSDSRTPSKPEGWRD